MSPEASSPRSGPAGTTSLLGLIRLDPRHSQAWDGLVDRYRPYIWTALRNSGIPQDAAEDLIQEVFLSVFGAIVRGGGFDRSKGTFKAYLAATISRTIFDYLQKAKKSPAALGGTDWEKWLANLPDQMALSDEIGMASSQFAEALVGDERVAMRLLVLVPQIVEKVKARMEDPEQFDELAAVVIGERTIEEAAAALNLKYGNANQKVFRLRRRLREEGQALLDGTRGGSHDE